MSTIPVGPYDITTMEAVVAAVQSHRDGRGEAVPLGLVLLVLDSPGEELPRAVSLPPPAVLDGAGS